MYTSTGAVLVLPLLLFQSLSTAFAVPQAASKLYPATAVPKVAPDGLAPLSLDDIRVLPTAPPVKTAPPAPAEPTPPALAKLTPPAFAQSTPDLITTNASSNTTAPRGGYVASQPIDRLNLTVLVDTSGKQACDGTAAFHMAQILPYNETWCISSFSTGADPMFASDGLGYPPFSCVKGNESDARLANCNIVGYDDRSCTDVPRVATRTDQGWVFTDTVYGVQGFKIDCTAANPPLHLPASVTYVTPEEIGN